MKFNHYPFNNLAFRSLIILTMILCFFRSNTLLTILSILIFVLILIFFWRPGISFIFGFILLWQWLQVTLKIFYADILNIDVSVISKTNSSYEAILLSMGGLLCLAAGIYITVPSKSLVPISVLKDEAKKYSLDRLFLIYLILTAVNFLLQVILFEYLAVTQIIIGLMNLKVLVIMILFFVSLLTGESKKYLTVIIILEIMIGFTGYFSTFKTILFLLIIASFTIYSRIKPVLFFKYAIVISLLLFLGIFWSSIREDYRSILNRGTGMQEVLISPRARVSALTDLAERLSGSDLQFGLELAIFRISYTDIFGQVIDRVPDYTSYENGAILINTIKHIIMPRLLFPNKKVIDDSEMTNYYTAKHYAGVLQGTSIGLGYMAEFYIDFGFFMFIPIFLLGCLYGMIYNFFMKKHNSKLLHLSMVIPVLFNVYLFETTQAKMVGGLLSAFIIMILINKYFLNFLIKRISK